MHNLTAVHHQRNVLCSYVLKLEGDEAAEFYIYVGFTRDLEMRILSHCGIRKPEHGSAWCKLHEPCELMSVCLHDTEAEAMLAEVASYNLWLAKVGPEPVRGGRNNGAGPLKYLPRGWPRKGETLSNEESTSPGSSGEGAISGGSTRGELSGSSNTE